MKNSSVYAMSLGSRELFHSNFWAWLMRKNPYMINVFFDKTIESVEVEKDEKDKEIFILNGNYRVKPEKLIQREAKHRDITINLSDGVYIIENKIKTLPDQKQLLKYQHSEKNFKMGCYTGLEDPNFDETETEVEINNKVYTIKFEHKKWYFLNYRDISQKILSVIDEHKFLDDFDEKITKQYCADISDLCCIISKSWKRITIDFILNRIKPLPK